eukprot:7174227-Alexandrium_andersonii.AAC.1
MQHGTHERTLKSRNSLGLFHPTSSRGQPLDGMQEEYLHAGLGCGASGGSVAASSTACPPRPPSALRGVCLWRCAAAHGWRAA